MALTLTLNPRELILEVAHNVLKVGPPPGLGLPAALHERAVGGRAVVAYGGAASTAHRVHNVEAGVELLVGAVGALDVVLDEAAMGQLDEIFPGPGGAAPEAYAW